MEQCICPHASHSDRPAKRSQISGPLVCNLMINWKRAPYAQCFVYFVVDLFGLLARFQLSYYPRRVTVLSSTGMTWSV